MIVKIRTSIFSSFCWLIHDDHDKNTPSCPSWSPISTKNSHTKYTKFSKTPTLKKLLVLVNYFDQINFSLILQISLNFFSIQCCENRCLFKKWSLKKERSWLLAKYQDIWFFSWDISKWKYGKTKFMNFLSEHKSRIKHRFYSFKFPNSCLDENYLGMKNENFQFSKKLLWKNCNKYFAKIHLKIILFTL